MTETTESAASLPFSDYILVIGSAHLDTMGDYRRDQERNIDKIGSVQYAVGGTAMNIAVNLAAAHKPVSLYTHLRRNSLVTDAILTRCEKVGVRTHFITVEDNLPESGFVAHRREGEVVAAISSMAIASAKLDEDRLRMALRGSNFAVMDCNLLEPQIKMVSYLAHEVQVPLIVAGVSEAKVERVLSAFQPPDKSAPITLFACNVLEAERLMGAPFDDWTGEALLHKANAENALVTRGTMGCSLFARGQSGHTFPSPQVPSIASTQGAGDALLAAFCGSFYDHSRFDKPDMIASILRYVGTALAAQSSTLDRKAFLQPVPSAPGATA